MGSAGRDEAMGRGAAATALVGVSTFDFPSRREAGEAMFATAEVVAILEGPVAGGWFRHDVPTREVTVPAERGPDVEAALLSRGFGFTVRHGLLEPAEPVRRAGRTH